MHSIFPGPGHTPELHIVIPLGFVWLLFADLVSLTRFLRLIINLLRKVFLHSGPSQAALPLCSPKPYFPSLPQCSYGNPSPKCQASLNMWWQTPWHPWESSVVLNECCFKKSLMIWVDWLPPEFVGDPSSSPFNIVASAHFGRNYDILSHPGQGDPGN